MNNEKVLLVLGASSDLGKALIQKIADRYDVILANYRSNPEFIDELQNGTNTKIIGYQADFTNLDSTQNLISQIQSDGYQPNHIVHFSADTAIPVKFHKVNWELFEKSFNVSLRSSMLVLKSFLPAMIKAKRGKIVFMLTSYVNNVPPKYQSIYVTTKYALLGLMKSLASDYADKRIQINAVSPEMIETKFLSDISEHIVEQNAASSPIGRNLNVEDVIPTLEFLLSEGSDCITGENIAITGGKR